MFPKESILRHQKSTASAKKDTSSCDSSHHQLYNKFRQQLKKLKNERIGWSEYLKICLKWIYNGCLQNFERHNQIANQEPHMEPLTGPCRSQTFPLCSRLDLSTSTKTDHRCHTAKHTKDRMPNTENKPMPRKLKGFSHLVPCDLSTFNTSRQIERPTMSTLFAARSRRTREL